jgi:hypothetical protein
MASAPPLVLPSLQELGLPPVATAKQVVEAVSDIICTNDMNCLTAIWVGPVKAAFNKRGLHLTPPANWVDIVRQAARPHYEVVPNSDPSDEHEVVTLRALNAEAAPDPTLVLEPCLKFAALTAADVIADVQEVLCAAKELSKWTEFTPLWWHYERRMPITRRPSWEFCRDVILKAAEPHWACTVHEDTASIAFHPKQ